MRITQRLTKAWYWLAAALLVSGLSACSEAGVAGPATVTTVPATVAPAILPPATLPLATLPPATPPPTPTTAAPAAQAASYADPFSYCATVGTIDTPDSRYTGPAIPDSVAQGLKNASGASADAPLDIFKNGTYWRCMDGKVYACFVGANLPCELQG